ncbi:protein TonB [Pseudomonas mucidolens]|uniref:Protein TonB n=1 Tax=Pseudomonas mucidolens TaxID=46679 RepID=A0A1H2MWL1_9PSED|nr:protein TonB [Pseudomonas mucidolens]SQH33079.1 ferric siderophore transporter, periplasmic energy transduction protein TonB [Pseudomonas mucidolens]
MGNVQSATRGLEVFRHPLPSGELLDLGRVFRESLALSRLHTTPKRVSSRREGLLLGRGVLVLHGAVIVWVNQAPAPVLPVVPPEIPPMTIEFSQPAPPVVELPPAPAAPPQPVAPLRLAPVT